MMVEKVKPTVRIDIGASARAELKAEVPASAMGRLVDALTDAIRPFTERSGLRADEIRLQREDVLIKIALKAKERLAVEGREPSPLPNKVLVPLLEKASLEDPDDEEMIARWAALLAAQSSHPNSNRRWAVDILAAINGWQARLLETISQEQSANEFFRVERFTRNAINDEFEETIEMAGTAFTEVRLKQVVEDLGGFTMFFDGRNIPNTNEFEFRDLPEGPDLLHLDVLGLIWLNAGSFVFERERHFLVNGQLSPLGAQFVSIFEHE
jgi:hypothetical protein